MRLWTCCILHPTRSIAGVRQPTTFFTTLLQTEPFFMSDLDHAHDLLAMARTDRRALKGMLEADDPTEDYFSDEIFGFHAQQAAEKILKARIASRGGVYGKTHDLKMLLDTLSDLEEDVSDLAELVDLNSYAVQYRYESFDTDEEKLDRASIFEDLESLFKRMKSLIG